MRLISIIITMLFINGCAATGPIFNNQVAADINSGILYIYRPYEFRGSAGSPYIYINGQYKDTLNTGGYLFYELTTGKHNIILGSIDEDYANWSPEPVKFSINIESGKSYYFRMLKDDRKVGLTFIPVGSSIMVGSSGTSIIGITQERQDEAMKEIRKTKLSR